VAFKKIKEIRNYLIVLLGILFNCSPFFLGVNRQFWIILFIILLFVIIKNRKRFIHGKVFTTLFAVWILITFQIFAFGSFSPAAIYQPVLVFYTPFLVFSIMGISYFRYLFKVIYHIAIFTSIVYIFQLLFPSFEALLSRLFVSLFQYSWADWPRSILVYSIPRESGYFFPRNSGAFHEPGAYAIYLILAIIINSITSHNSLNKKNIFLSLVLLSTFSTGGYVMLFILLIYTVWDTKINAIFKIMVLSVFVVFSYSIFQKADFLQKKIENQIENQSIAIEKGKESQTGRLYYFLKTAQEFLASPIIGRGIIRSTSNTEEGEGIVGLGFMGLFARFGIFFGAFYMWFFYKGLRDFCVLFNTSPTYIIIAFIVINIGLLSQSFFFHISFVMFFIIGLLNRKPVPVYNKYSRILNKSYSAG
jgi:hypothetical protein